MEKVFNSDFYSKLHTLRMSIAISMASGMSGARKSNEKGNSVEFSDFREYRLGDDIRRIDWNAYGRFDKLFVKLFMEEKEGLFQIFLDASKSMDFGEKNKSVCAQRIAGALSYVVLENSDRLFLNICKEGKILAYNGMTGMQSFKKVTEYLENVTFEGEGDLLSSIKNRDIRKRGMSFLITDGYCDNLEEVIKYLKFKNQDVVLCHVLSREELDPQFEGTVELADCETDAFMRMTMSASMMKSYKKRFEAFLQSTQALCKKYSVIYIPVYSEDSIESIFFASLSKLATNS